MFASLIPDYMFLSYREVTPTFLRKIGVRALLLDIDNTLVPYEQAEPDNTLRAWFAALSDAGIGCALISNNRPPRAEQFNRSLGFPCYTNSAKPCKKNLVRAMQELGVTHTETAILGDQLLTDAYAGRRIGLRTLIVPPIKDKTTPFFRFKRFLERPFYRAYMKRHPEYHYPGLDRRQIP